MTVWVVHVGRSAEREAFMLSANKVVTGWEDVEDLSRCLGLSAVKDALFRARGTESSAHQISVWASQLWNFVSTIQVGDLVVVPLKTKRYYKIGRVEGSYEFLSDCSPECRHSRRVKWLCEIFRDDVPKDMRGSFKAHMSVYTASRNGIEDRLKAIIN